MIIIIRIIIIIINIRGALKVFACVHAARPRVHELRKKLFRSGSLLIVHPQVVPQEYQSKERARVGDQNACLFIFRRQDPASSHDYTILHYTILYYSVV